MTKKNGREVSEEIKKINSQIKFLFMSGYPSDVFYDNGVFDKSIDFIQKPVSPLDITKKIREILDNKK